MTQHIGKVREPSYSLPPNDFVFGVANKMDNEGAGQGLLLLK